VVVVEPLALLVLWLVAPASAAAIVCSRPSSRPEPLAPPIIPPSPCPLCCHQAEPLCWPAPALPNCDQGDGEDAPFADICAANRACRVCGSNCTEPPPDTAVDVAVVEFEAAELVLVGLSSASSADSGLD